MWSTDTFSHVRQAVEQLAARVQAMQALLAHGPDVADPQTVHAAGHGLEDALASFWAPVAWDSPVFEGELL